MDTVEADADEDKRDSLGPAVWCVGLPTGSRKVSRKLVTVELLKGWQERLDFHSKGVVAAVWKFSRLTATSISVLLSPS